MPPDPNQSNHKSPWSETRVVDPHWFDADPAFFLTADPVPDLVPNPEFWSPKIDSYLVGDGEKVPLLIAELDAGFRDGFHAGCHVIVPGKNNKCLYQCLGSGLYPHPMGQRIQIRIGNPDPDRLNCPKKKKCSLNVLWRGLRRHDWKRSKFPLS